MFMLISSGHIFEYKTTAPSYKALKSSNNGILHKLATLLLYGVSFSWHFSRHGVQCIFGSVTKCTSSLET